MHVFTSEVIAPDLYDSPLTLRVPVHQHQAKKNTQGHVGGRTRSSSPSLSGPHINIECAPINPISSALFAILIQSHKVEIILLFFLYITVPPLTSILPTPL